MKQQRVRKSYKYRLMPTPEQERALASALLRCRTLYTCAVEQRKTWWERGHGKSATYSQQQNELPDLKAACPEYGAVPSQVWQDVVRRVDQAFQAFFRRVKHGETPGYPRFQGRNRYNRFTSPPVGGQGGAVLDSGMLSRSKIGRIPSRLHRPMGGSPKTVTISKAADGWYAGISCAEVPTQPLPLTGHETGIAVGLKVVLVTVDAEYVESARHHRTAEKGLKKAPRRVSCRTTGSKRWWKALGQCAKRYQTVKRQRGDFHHKTALALVREYDVIDLEDVQLRHLSRRPKAMPHGQGGYLKNGASRKAGLNKSIQDAGWYRFRRILTCTAAWAGKRGEAIPPAFTTQDCSGCGERIFTGLSMRTHVCTSCGLMLDRDENAARNMLRAGQARQAVTWPTGASVA